nr:hypothetical protein [Tanacetum cinerariifolium]GEX32138.1 hypothetical protein [Tanacetum cinerariifolium]
MYDEVQEGIKADALFVAKLQQEEREEYTIKERANFLAETTTAQRKFRATQSSAEIRSRPPTISTEEFDGYKYYQLKGKTFVEIQGLYERLKRFYGMDLEKLYNIMMQRYVTTSPEGVDLVLWDDLRTMFQETADNDLWKNQEEWILKS